MSDSQPREKNNITIVMAYYQNGGMLDRHFQEWALYPDEVKSHYNVIIADDGSPTDPAFHHIPDNLPFPVQLFRIKPDIPWNQNGARNLCMTHASGWCLMTDMDHLLTVEMASMLLSLKLNDWMYYIPQRRRAVDGLPYHRHPNTYIITKDMFWKAGGYDEAYAGYYGTDSTFRGQLSMVGSRCELNDFYMLLFGREVIPDASTTTYGRKGTEYYLSNNQELWNRKKKRLKPIPPLNFEWERLL